MDLGLSGKSKVPSRRRGLDLGLFGKSKVPSKRGGLDLGHLRKSKVPSRRGGLDLGLAKILEPVPRGGVLEKVVSITPLAVVPKGKMFDSIFAHARTPRELPKHPSTTHDSHTH